MMVPGSWEQQQHQMETDDDDADYYYESSSYGESITTDPTMSLRSRVSDYYYENGRRYHRYQAGQYTAPNDESEQDRLDLHHHMYRVILNGKLHTAPLGANPKRILDCGTATGIWALDMAEAYPSAKITGVDLSPIQPTWVYPNVSFEVDDLEKDWTWPWNHFDYIHSRAMGNGIKDWPRYARQMFKHTKHGGYVELVEIELRTLHCDDETFNENCALYRYIACFNEGADRAGLKIPDVDAYVGYLREAGFADIVVTTKQQPWGMWPKDKELKKIGSLTGLQSVTGMEAYAAALFTRYLHMPAEEMKQLCHAAATEVVEATVHVYNHIWFIIGRKPEREPRQRVYTAPMELQE